MVFRARCCNPIRGEKIVGYITRGKGVSVHSATCPNVVNLLYDPERRIDVEWDKGDRRLALHRAADDAGRGSEGHAGRRQREDRRHQHQHHATWKRTTDDDQHGADRHDRRDQRREAPEKVIKSLRGVDGRAGRGAGGAVSARRRRSEGRQSSAQQDGDDVDLDARVLRQPRDLDGRARRARAPRSSVAVDLVHRGEVVHVRQEDRGPDDVIERRARGLEDAPRFWKTRRVCARCRPSTICPVAGSSGI